ncbi:MAG: hypothetical protein WCH99_14990 [Verrucomicrobiota bacterium]
MKTKGSIAIVAAIALVCAALSFTSRAGTFTSDFTKGVDANYWGVWTYNASTAVYTNFIDAQGVTFQRFADLVSDPTPRASGGLTLNQAAMQKITTNGGSLVGDFVVTMAYTNLNHLVSSTYSFWVQGINRMKLRLTWGDADKVHVVQAFSTSRNYYGVYYKTAFQGSFFESATPWTSGELRDFDPAVSGSAGTFTLARTNGVLSFYVNGQQLGVGEGPSSYTTNDIKSVELMMGQEWETAHIGVTFQSCTISGPGVKGNAPVTRPVLRHTPKGDGKLTFEWDTTPGQTCHVESTTNLGNPDWQPVGNSITATNSTASISYPAGGEIQRFYRVVTP